MPSIASSADRAPQQAEKEPSIVSSTTSHRRSSNVSATSQLLSITVAVEDGPADAVVVPWWTTAEDLIEEFGISGGLVNVSALSASKSVMLCANLCGQICWSQRESLQNTMVLGVRLLNILRLTANHCRIQSAVEVTFDNNMASCIID